MELTFIEKIVSCIIIVVCITASYISIILIERELLKEVVKLFNKNRHR